MSRINVADRSAYSPPVVGLGVKLIVNRHLCVDGPNRKPWRRMGPAYRIEPAGTCPICFGVGGCGWEDRFIPCWNCSKEIQCSSPGD